MVSPVWEEGLRLDQCRVIDEGQLWALTAYTIFASTVIHGLTPRDMVRLLDRDSDMKEAAPGDGAAPD